MQPWRAGDLAISTLDGFFARSRADGRIWFTGATAANELAVISSADQGQTWRTHAVVRVTAGNLYAIGGQQDLTADGSVIGSFTAVDPLNHHSSVHFFRVATADDEAPTIALTTVDADADSCGTYQSHNQKVIATRNGWFLTHVHWRGADPDRIVWRLSRSTDAGRSFTTLLEDTDHFTFAPALAASTAGDLYLIHSDHRGNACDAWLLAFDGGAGDALVRRTLVPGGGAHQFTLVLDEPRRQLYYLASIGSGEGDERFYILGMDGAVKRDVRLTVKGRSAVSHYPHLYLDDEGVLYAAWTTVRSGEFTYWSIHVVKSADGGISWRKLDGTQLGLPIVADESGPTDRITDDSQLVPSTWLSSFMVDRGKVHFAYREDAGPGREPRYCQHYARADR